jgi:spore coat polysaccharide biosynthesis predicted glycosyltransferase SpsG/CMP-N-acetylneuraminic acid synthetase
LKVIVQRVARLILMCGASRLLAARCSLAGLASHHAHDTPIEMGLNNLLVVVPAPLHGSTKMRARLPRKVLRPLAGRPLLEYIVTTAARVVEKRSQIVVVTEDDEVALLAERLGCKSVVDERSAKQEPVWDRLLYDVIVEEERKGGAFDAVLLLRPSAPLVVPADIDGALDLMLEGHYDSVLSATEETHHAWARVGGRYVPDFGVLPQAERSGDLYRETGAFVVSRRDTIQKDRFVGSNVGLALLPASRAIDITSSHEWWICERIKQKRRIVFVVAGNTNVGTGHIYRSTQIANEINNHEVSFVCLADSRLAHDVISAGGYPSVLVAPGQRLESAVLDQSPDMVVNDFLDTTAAYVEVLKSAGVKVVNFEDLGSGAACADLVINELYIQESPLPNHRVGSDYFCIREEFLSVQPAPFREPPREVLITFGGTDSENLTARTLQAIWPEAERRGMRISVVTGIGYEHDAYLQQVVSAIGSPNVHLANGTKRISDFMARADIAFSGSGRTLFELATMRVPSVVMACNPREERHPFATSHSGFRYLGRHDTVTDADLRYAFVELTDRHDARRAMYDALARFDFQHGKQRVVSELASTLGIPLR